MIASVALLVPFAVFQDGAKAAAPAVEGSTTTGGGVLSARLEFGTRRLLVRSCTTAPCDPSLGEATPLSISDEIDPSGSTVKEVALENGARALRVIAKSAARNGVAWEAIVASIGGKAHVVWSGGTGFGAEGESAGHRVLVEGKTITIGDLRREITMCGQEETLLAPRRLDPASMTLHAIALPRIAKAVRDAAPTIPGTLASDAPIGSVLGLRGASTHDGASSALVDGDLATAWTEARKGDGRGEFVVFSAPKDLPIERLSLVVRPTAAIADFAQPRWVWVVVDDATYAVSIPEAKDPGARVDVVLPKPTSTSCVAIALERAEEAKGDPAVGLAEVDGVPSFPASVKSLDDLVTFLDTDDHDVLARVVLGNAGARGADVIEKHLASLGNRGKSEAVDVLEATPCSAAANALVHLAWDAPKETATAAREALDACGAAAKPAIEAAFEAGPDLAREVLADRLARIDPAAALKAILARVPSASPARRRSYRGALSRIVASDPGRDAIVAWLAHPPPPVEGEADPSIELARAVATRDEAASIAPKILDALLPRLAVEDAHAFDRRYLAAEPIAAFAAKEDARAIAWLRALFKSTDRYLRARAAAVSANAPSLRSELLTAARDADPRVRQAAFQALRVASAEQGAATAIPALHEDAWTYVRVAAADLLGDVKQGADVDAALANALKDDMPDVRIAAIRALVSRGAKTMANAIRARATDGGELVDVRTQAIDALGSLCDQASADALTDLARKVNTGDRAHVLGLAAIVALGRIHPKDLKARLEGIDTSVMVVKDAVERAVKSVGGCQ